ncbi:MAG: BrnT family toxin [Pseudomonadota bacterium]
MTDVRVEYDENKRQHTLLLRKLDMADAQIVFSGPTLTFPDVRGDYGEDRFLTVGHLRARMVIICWTPRNDAYRIISMRKTNERETKSYRTSLGMGG